MDDHQPDAQSKPCQNPGSSNVPSPALAADPQRLARQAIRSQATARQYAERQLLRAEQMIRDLGTKLHALRHEKGDALEAARTAQTALAQAERNLRGVEAALIGEKAARERAQRDAQEARATVHELRTKLILANQTVDTLQTQLGRERRARNAAEPSAAHSPPFVAEVADAPSDQPVKRGRGRPSGKRNASGPRLAVGQPYAGKQKPVQWWIKG